MTCLSSTLLPVPDGPQERNRLALADLEVDAVQHHLFAERLMDVAKLDH